MLNRRVGHFGAKFGEEGVDRCKPNFEAIWERRGAVMCKEIVSISSAVEVQSIIFGIRAL